MLVPIKSHKETKRSPVVSKCIIGNTISQNINSLTIFWPTITNFHCLRVEMSFLSVLTLQLSLVVLPPEVATQRCNQGTLRTRHGFVLKGHVFRSFVAEKLALCYSACNTSPACQSLNFNLANKSCEFNSEFSKSRPESLIESPVHVFADNPDRGEWLYWISRMMKRHS